MSQQDDAKTNTLRDQLIEFRKTAQDLRQDRIDRLSGQGHKGGWMQLKKIENSSLQAASLGTDFVGGKTLYGTMEKCKVELCVPAKWNRKVNYWEKMDLSEETWIGFDGWVERWNHSQKQYQLIATGIHIPFEGTLLGKTVIFLIMALVMVPVMGLLLFCKWVAILFWPILGCLVIWRIVEWDQKFGCQIDMWLFLTIFGGGMLKFYWWAINYSPHKTMIKGIDTPVDELETLTNDKARILAKHEGDLHLLSLEKLTDDQAKILCQHRGGTLQLGGLLSLTDSQAQSLATHEGCLLLPSVSRLSDQQAESLSRYSGELYLDSLQELGVAQVESFKRFKGVYLELPAEFSQQLGARLSDGLLE